MILVDSFLIFEVFLNSQICDVTTGSKRYVAPGVCRRDAGSNYEMATCFDNSAELKTFSDSNCEEEIMIEEEYTQNCTFYRSFFVTQTYVKVML